MYHARPPPARCHVCQHAMSDAPEPEAKRPKTEPSSSSAGNENFRISEEHGTERTDKDDHENKRTRIGSESQTSENVDTTETEHDAMDMDDDLSKDLLQLTGCERIV